MLSFRFVNHGLMARFLKLLKNVLTVIFKELIICDARVSTVINIAAMGCDDPTNKTYVLTYYHSRHPTVLTTTPSSVCLSKVWFLGSRYSVWENNAHKPKEHKKRQHRGGGSVRRERGRDTRKIDIIHHYGGQ